MNTTDTLALSVDRAAHLSTQEGSAPGARDDRLPRATTLGATAAPLARHLRRVLAEVMLTLTVFLSIALVGAAPASAATIQNACSVMLFGSHLLLLAVQRLLGTAGTVV